MKSKVIFTFLILATLTALLSVSGLAGVGPLANPSLQSGAPTVVSYQGQVTVGGSAYNGTGYFKFAVVNTSGDSTYWSNDGTSTDGGEPTNGCPLPVSNGFFNVLLGDLSLTNMNEALSASVFSGTGRYMRVWFSSDNINFQLLIPDRRIAAVPFALQAQQAANADTLDGSHASAFADVSHSHNGLLPTGAMVLSSSKNDTTLISAGFSYTSLTLEPGWHIKASIPTGRAGLAAAVVDGVIYTIGGGAQGEFETRYNEAYNPATNSWKTMAEMPTKRHGLAAAAVDGVIYAIGGYAGVLGQFETANEVYNPAINSWKTRAPMPTGRTLFASAVVDGVIYAIGGASQVDFNLVEFDTVNEAYNPATNSWDTRTPISFGRSNVAAAAADGLIYIIGGASSSTDYENKNEVYDPVTDSWESRASMPTGRRRPAAVFVNGLIHVLGGMSSPDKYEAANEAYNPATNTWSSMADMPTARQNLAAVGLDGVIYAFGGTSDGGVFATANEAYDPVMFVYVKD